MSILHHFFKRNKLICDLSVRFLLFWPKKAGFVKKNAVIQNPILFEKGMDIRGKT